MSKDTAVRNWWGTAWVEKMTRLAEPTRFAEGEKYARTGRVLSIRSEGRTINGRVQGPSELASTVRISFDAFSGEQWERLFAQVRDRAAFASSLSSGDLPLEIHAAFSKSKLRFMPERFVDLHLECACPDWLKPCKHMVALWLKFARDFDRDPFLLFELRGLRRDEVLALLRVREPAAAAEPVAEEFPEIVIPLNPEALPADPAAFWSAPPLPATPSETPDRRLLDDDIFQRLEDWPGNEPQFHQIYDAVYQLATLLRS
jgi:uncharacterized Zn finger protein